MIVRVKTPRVVDAVVRTVIVTDPGALNGFGARLAEEPAGSPDTDRDTAPVKPPLADTATVYDALCPRDTVTPDGLAAA